jgi:hypothetical protein
VVLGVLGVLDGHEYDEDEGRQMRVREPVEVTQEAESGMYGAE